MTTVRTPARVALGGLTVLGLAGGLVLVGGVTGGPAPGAPSPRPVATLSVPAAPDDALGRSIAARQTQLAANPNDYQGWADLGLAYVQQAKITVDPSYYPRAEGALSRSLALNSKDNFSGLAGEAALQAALHNFRAARTFAMRGIAINHYSATLFGALADAETQLGNYDAAAKAVQRMNDLTPGVPAFTRASYVFELRGDVAHAEQALQRSLRDSVGPADTAFVDYYLGELAFNYGRDLNKALAYYASGLVASPRDYTNLDGQAKVEAAMGATEAALRDYRAVVAAAPQPQYVLELAELEESLHLPDAARQYALFHAEERLFTASGVTLDVEPTLFEADHGSPARALAYATAGWQVRPFVEMADAYAWAEHVNGHDAAALTWSERALATGWSNALFLFHRGMEEKGLGRTDAARRDLRKALSVNPDFNVLQAPVARQALAALGG